MKTEGKMIVVDLLVYKLTMENNNMMLLNHIEIEAIQDLSLYPLNGDDMIPINMTTVKHDVNAVEENHDF